MPRYQYLAKNMEGKTVQDIEEANGEQVLIDKLQAQGYFVISLQMIRESVKSEVKKIQKVKKDPFSHNNVTMDDILVFARQLATMLEAGITLLRSLDVILSQIESRTLHKVLTQVRNDV